MTRPPNPDESYERMQAFMDEEKWDEALKAFGEIESVVPPEDMAHAFCNNAAICLEALKRPEKALEILAGNIRAQADPDPFAHALAARILGSLGREFEAKVQIKEAIADFERGLRVFGRSVPREWREYLVVLQNAAGSMGDDRLVLDIHRRWEPYCVTNENYFYAGTAAFNLGRYRQASAYWRPHFHDDWSRIMEGYAVVAGEVERGLIPPFRLSYQVPDRDELTASIKEKYEPAELILLLAMAANENYDSDFVATLCQFTGDWGEQLARNLTRHATVSEGVKLQAAMALVQSGRHPAGEPFEIIVDGRPKIVRIEHREIVFEDEKAEKILKRARKLQKAGQGDEAVNLLQAVCSGTQIYAPAALALADMHYERGELEDSAPLLEMLHGAEPDNPQIAFNLAAIYAQLGDEKLAGKILGTIDPAGEDPDFQKKYLQLKTALGRLESC